ncbi:MAG: hypothetical protein Ct9H300mP16_14870 [Pseudomonadota bacterium]|nr:MAG: hypothetical protein Ct9H300mP16_14870 [Pseudomonadota bacterium]
MNAAFKVVDLNLARKPGFPRILRAQYRLASLLVLKNIPQVDRVLPLSLDADRGGPVSPQLVRWYLALGLQLLEVYGQTENVGMATVTYPGEVKLGSVGKPVP